MERLSLLFPPGADDCTFVASNGDIIKSLELAPLFYSPDIDWRMFLTADVETIRYRQHIFKDIDGSRELERLFNECAEKLENVTELAKMRSDNSWDNEANLYTIKEIEIFIDFVSTLYSGLCAHESKISSEGLKALYLLATKTYESEDFCALRQGVDALKFSSRSIKSVTLGINLDERLSPYEAGIVDINDRYFHSGDIVSRFMRMESKSDGMLTLAPLSAVGNAYAAQEKGLLTSSLISALSKIVGVGFRSWKTMLHKYFLINTAPYLALLPEIKVINRGVGVIREMRRLRMAVCYPEMCRASDRCFEASELYHPTIAKTLRESDPDARVVPNDITFDENGMIYVLTGPNRGGKSVFLTAVGAAQFMLQLGLPVAAKKLRASPVDGIFTHLPQDAGNTVGKGRFGEECDRLQKMLCKVSESSLVLLDESLSGTNSYEASAIAQEVLSALSVMGCRGIFSTHLFELAKTALTVNESPDARSKVDNLVMGINGGERTFEVLRQEPDGKSYARDIADRYGLSADMILQAKKGNGDGE